MTIRSLFHQNRYFFISYFVLLTFGFFILLTYSQAQGFILMNPWHDKPLDYVFIGVTLLGDGWFAIALVVLLFVFRKRFLSLMVLSSYALSGIIAQIIKNLYDSPRPAKFLGSGEYSYFIDGITLRNYSSFPSGHTTTAFALAAALAFSIKNKNYSIGLLLIAALIGYSRIYLGQHFMQDVLAGSVIGVMSAVICELFLYNWLQKITAKKIET